MKEESKNIKIIVATHKKYNMPKDDMYIPIHVGKEGKEELGYIGDNTGENISYKNSTYCELTGLYWGWKNLQCDYLGLAHYRRHFAIKRNIINFNKSKQELILNKDYLEKIIAKYQVIVPKKRKYYIESLYDHYKHTHYSEHLDITKEIIERKYPKYSKYLERAYNSKSGYMFNMYIMEKNLSDEYCQWLFEILFELENEIDISNLSAFQGRFLGRVSEIIFNCWLMFKIEEENIKVKELNVIHMDKINWVRKVSSFLKAKYLNKKYEAGF